MVAVVHELTVSARRDMRALGAALAEAVQGAPVAATFVVDRYGVFAVRGTISASGAAGTLTLAGRFIEQGMKPDRALRSLEPLEGVGTNAVLGGNELALLLGDIRHGDVVRADFRTTAYGSFSITGVCVWSALAGYYILGGWYLVPERLDGIEVLVRAGDHEYVVPPQITGPLAEDDPSA